MKKFNCQYRDLLDDSGNLISMSVEAATPKEAYEKFIETVGVYPKDVVVDGGILLTKIFNNHKSKSESDKIEGKIDSVRPPKQEDIIKRINKNNEEKSYEKQKQNELPTDERMLVELVRMREELNEVSLKLSNLKWVALTIAIMIYVTFRMGL